MVIVGAGFGGIAAVIELRRHGITDITILEGAPEAGGTWFHNTYPGAACDVPSHLYSFSYAQRRDWSRLCSPQQEILDYLNGVARDHGVDRLIVGSSTVTACAWDDDARRWTVSTAEGPTYAADSIIVATGQLHPPAIPRLKGAERFAGHSFHSARWDHDYDLRGKRVAVIGTGASAVQFVPEIAERAAHLTVFQRSGNWFLPRRNRPYPAAIKTLVARVPRVQAARRRYMFLYCEALTLCIRFPRTLGRLLGLRAAAFMRRHEPSSFIAAIDPDDDRTWMELLFLSFTTLTSTGLSDVVPVKGFARGVVMIEQLAELGYVAMVVSRLVALMVLNPRRRGEKRS